MIQKYVLYVVIAIAAVSGAGGLGYWKGRTDSREENLTQHVKSLNESITDLNAATKEAGQLNLKLGKTISARIKADQQSTQVFTNALAATSHLRFNCVFDDNIMQQLDQAADRADQAASSGISYSLPARSPPDG